MLLRRLFLNTFNSGSYGWDPNYVDQSKREEGGVTHLRMPSSPSPSKGDKYGSIEEYVYVPSPSSSSSSSMDYNETGSGPCGKKKAGGKAPPVTGMALGAKITGTLQIIENVVKLCHYTIDCNYRQNYFKIQKLKF